MKPTLLVLAAGMGSRYGGLKQLDGLGPHGETIMDYSIYDAIHAGFGKIVFVIRKDIETEFREKILSKYEGHIAVEVVFQSIDDLPDGFTRPEGRTKPWGTNHAVMMAEGVIDEPFAVINADDFYGRDAFEAVARQLSEITPHKYSLVGFRVGNTMSPNGSVARGVCSVDDDGLLTDVAERKDIRYDDKGRIVCSGDDGEICVLAPETPVSMNLWGLMPDYFSLSKHEFEKFLKANAQDPKAEMTIPDCMDGLIKEGKASVKVLDTTSVWFGVTYAGDRPGVVEKFAELHARGIYPDKMF